jgi:probable phosphoglycerate mutase
MKEIYFVRHGETFENKDGIVQGDVIGGILTEKGRSQARVTGSKLASLNFDVALVSDLSRTVETYKEIRPFLEKKLDVLFLSELRERGFGFFSGRTYEEAEIRIDDMAIDYRTDNEGPYITGKSIDQVMHENSLILKRVMNSRHERFLIVSHGFRLSYLFNFLNGVLAPKELQFYDIKNGQISYARLDGKGRLAELNLDISATLK